ncbi:hypothetical protein D3C87_1593800 [compost metagenome]
MRGGEQLIFTDVDEALDGHALKTLPEVHETLQDIEAQFAELSPDVADTDLERVVLSLEHARLEKQALKLGAYCAARGLIDDRLETAA